MADPNLGNVTVDDVYQVQFVGTLHGQRIRNVIHYIVTAAPAPTPRYAFLGQLLSRLLPAQPGSMGSKIIALTSSEYLMDFMQAQQIKPTRTLYRRQTVGTPGAQEDGCEASNVAAVITKRTQFASRDGIGSFHVGGIPTTSMADNLWNVDVQDSLAELAVTLKADLSDSFADAWTVSPCLAPRVGSVVLPFKIVDTIVHPEIRTMRGRTKGRGE